MIKIIGNQEKAVWYQGKTLKFQLTHLWDGFLRTKRMKKQQRPIISNELQTKQTQVDRSSNKIKPMQIISRVNQKFHYHKLILSSSFQLSRIPLWSDESIRRGSQKLACIYALIHSIKTLIDIKPEATWFSDNEESTAPIEQGILNCSTDLFPTPQIKHATFLKFRASYDSWQVLKYNICWW